MQFRLRLNLHALAYVASAFGAFYGISRAFDVASTAQYRTTYERAEYVVERVIGKPDFYTEGRIEPKGGRHREPLLRTLRGDLVLRGDPAVSAQVGARMPVWASTNADAPVVATAARSCIDDERMIGVWIAFSVGVFFTGLSMATRLGKYFQRTSAFESGADE
jgi:hypothetical protein